LAPSPVRVVFVTTVFEGTDTGPGTYARYLWNTFRDDPDLEFHLVAPEVAERHPHLHASGLGSGPLDLYRRVQKTGLRVASGLGPGTIVHGNAAHSMGRFVGYPGSLLVQVNDYDVATFPERALAILRQRGVRRLLGSAWRYWNERRVLRHAALAICNSNFTAAAIRRAYGVCEERTRVIHKAVDTSGFRRPAGFLSDRAEQAPGERRLLFVGADWRRKGLDLLLKALADLASEFPGAVLTVIGPDRNDPALLQEVAGRGLQDRVAILGRLGPDQVARRLWNADVFVLPSRREALGVAVLEAMAAGVPVVATSVGGIPEILRPGKDGILVEPDDPKALAAELRRVLQDSDLRSRLALSGPARATEFSVQAMVRAIKGSYLSVADEVPSAERHVD
jgi:glycosyltransferase involved in cell wall biosynthesis